MRYLWLLLTLPMILGTTYSTLSLTEVLLHLIAIVGVTMFVCDKKDFDEEG